MMNRIKHFLFGATSTTHETQMPEVRTPLSMTPHATEQFLTSLKGIGHPDYPILDRTYSPNSRVPCVDLVPFISERIVAGDIVSIKQLMRMVIEGNPGLGIGPSWIDEGVDRILSIPFEKYVSFSAPSGLPELKAFFIVAQKDGGGLQFRITGQIPRLVAWASMVYQPQWSSDLHSLAIRANSWIGKLAADYPESIWSGYAKFTITVLPTTFIDTRLREKIISLTPAARLQLFYAVEKGGGSLWSMTNGLTSGPIRSLGINTSQTSHELLASGLIIPSCSPGAIEASHSRQELIALCKETGVTFSQSWAKEKLAAAIAECDPARLQMIAQSKNIVAPNFQLYPSLRDIVRVAEEHHIGFQLLCFA